MLFKKLLVVFSVTVLLFAAVGCENNKTQLKGPPALKVLYEDKSIEAKYGTYSWTIENNDGSKKTTNADSSGPAEIVRDSTPLTLSPKSAITLSFSDKPEKIEVNIWQENKQIKQAVTDNKVITSELKGSVIYEVIGTWKQGTVSYAFLVNIN